MMPIITHKLQPGQLRLPKPYRQYIITNKGEIKNTKTWKWLKQSRVKTKRGNYILRVSLRNTTTGKYDVHVLKDLMARCWAEAPDGINRWDWNIAVNASLKETTENPLYDIRPDNLVWNPGPKVLLKVRNIVQRKAARERMMGNDFKAVPGYSGYLITREGVVGCISTDRIWRVPPDLTYRLRLVSDVGVGTTRKACHWIYMTYGDSRPIGDRYRLGFKDGNPHNTDLSNLYWIE